MTESNSQQTTLSDNEGDTVWGGTCDDDGYCALHDTHLPSLKTTSTSIDQLQTTPHEIKQFADTFLNACAEDTVEYGPSVIAALFDLIVSAEYVVHMAGDGEWVYCPGDTSDSQMNVTSFTTDENTDDGGLYLPFLNSCPRCSVKENTHHEAPRNKPPSAKIGDIAENVLLILLDLIVSQHDIDAEVRKISGQHDIDALVTTSDTVVVGETKASPLTALPLRIPSEAQRSLPDPHGTVSPSTLDGAHFHLPHTDVTIPLGAPASPGWPYSQLSTHFQHPKLAREYIESWRKLEKAYQSRSGDAKWLTCGCGGSVQGGRTSVDDSKNRPGLDRTDDIKKALAKSLNLNHTYRDTCETTEVKVVLISNYLSEDRYDEYLKPATDYRLVHQDDLVRRDGKAITDGSTANPIHDAIICPSHPVHRSECTESLLGFRSLLDGYNPLFSSTELPQSELDDY